MGLLTPMGTSRGYLKAGILGFPKSGKTYTAALWACGVRDHFGLSGPVAMFDTEGGSEYIARTIRAKSGADFIGIKSRSFDDLMSAAQEAESEGISVLIVDSITHVWRELMDSYMRRMNEARIAQNKQPRSRMQLQDIMKVKDLWSRWPDWYLNSRLHIIICGRAGFEWDRVEDEDTGEKQLTKTGVKMKVESEFGFEPSLLVEMVRDQVEENGRHRILHRATILGDRFGVIDGMECNDPDFDFIRPHVELLSPAGEHRPIDVEPKSQVPVDAEGDAEWHHEKKTRVILCEEIQGELLRVWPGQTKEDKTAKAEAIERAFDTRSWTRVESMDSERLREGLALIRQIVAEATKEAS